MSEQHLTNDQRREAQTRDSADHFVRSISAEKEANAKQIRAIYNGRADGQLLPGEAEAVHSLKVAAEEIDGRYQAALSALRAL